MVCITEQIYDSLRKVGIVPNLQEMSRLCGKRPSYLRSIYAKGMTCSIDGMLVLYTSLHRQIHTTTNPAYAAIMRDMQRLLWINIQNRAEQKLEAVA